MAAVRVGPVWAAEPAGSGGEAAASLRLPASELDLELTLSCGQAFRWRPLPAGARRAVVRGRQITLHRAGERLHAAMTPGPFDSTLLNRYLDLRLNLADVCREVDRDEHIHAALERYPGLRILQQEPWETLISFILSQWSNVPRISSQVEALARQYGKEVAPNAFAFPTPEALARASTEELRALGLGYRVEYVLRAARKCADGGVEWLEGLAQRDYRAARDQIVLPVSPRRSTEKVHGVGPKVADCVLLFSLGHYEAFPIDVHVRRAMERWYGDRVATSGSYDGVGNFAREHFGRFAGYAQQYLFQRQRVGSKESGDKPAPRR